MVDMVHHQPQGRCVRSILTAGHGQQDGQTIRAIFSQTKVEHPIFVEERPAPWYLMHDVGQPVATVDERDVAHDDAAAAAAAEIEPEADLRLVVVEALLGNPKRSGPFPCQSRT